MKIPKKIDLTALPYPAAGDLADDLKKAASNEQDGLKEKKSASAAEIKKMTNALVSITHQSWRMGAAILDPETKEPKSEFSEQDARKAASALEKITNTLESLGIIVKDRKGLPFDAGLPEKVLTEEAKEGLSKEQIIRTVQPTIMWHQTMVQRGQIDIATPLETK